MYLEEKGQDATSGAGQDASVPQGGQPETSAMISPPEEFPVGGERGKSGHQPHPVSSQQLCPVSL